MFVYNVNIGGESMFEILKRAVENKMPVEMIYMSAKGDISQRIITVYDVNQIHIKAFCHARKQVRIFKMDNILSLLPHKQKRKFVS